MNRRVMAVTAAAVMSMSSFAVPAMADEEEAVSIQISASIMSMDPLIGGSNEVEPTVALTAPITGRLK